MERSREHAQPAPPQHTHTHTHTADQLENPKTNVLRRYLLPVSDGAVGPEDNSDAGVDSESATGVEAADKQRADDLIAELQRRHPIIKEQARDAGLF